MKERYMTPEEIKNLVMSAVVNNNINCAEICKIVKDMETYYGAIEDRDMEHTDVINKAHNVVWAILNEEMGYTPDLIGKTVSVTLHNGMEQLETLGESSHTQELLDLFTNVAPSFSDPYGEVPEKLFLKVFHSEYDACVCIAVNKDGFWNFSA